LLPQGGCAGRLGGMDEKKRRLIDDDIVVTFIYDFEVEEGSNGIMEEGICLSSKAITRSAVVEASIPVLDLTNKTVLPKTPQP
jgi:hypothetical protein